MSKHSDRCLQMNVFICQMFEIDMTIWQFFMNMYGPFELGFVISGIFEVKLD